jgi:hypothetical protein
MISANVNSANKDKITFVQFQVRHYSGPAGRQMCWNWACVVPVHCTFR